MEFFIAAALAALAVGLLYGILQKRSKPPRPKTQTFVCQACNEQHCQCDRQA